MQITPRILKEAKAQASVLSNRIHVAWQLGKLKSWTDIERLFNLAVPQTFKDMPWSYANLSIFKTFWISNVEQRLQLLTTPTTSEPKVIINKDVSKFGTFTLYPEQEGCYRSIYEAFTERKYQAILQDGFTGAGKMIIGCAVIKKWVDDGMLDLADVKFRLHPIIIFTPKIVAETWRRTIEAFGLGKLLARQTIRIFNDSEFPTREGQLFVQEHEDMTTGEVSLIWNPIMCPKIAILDESHRYVNPKSYRTKCIRALVQCKMDKHIAWMSATPMETINNSYLFAIACNAELLGMKVTHETFKYFAGLLDATPQKPNREAMKRLRQVLSPYIFSIPYVKPKFKAINMVQLIDFECAQHQQIYESAHQRYIEACSKAGKNTMYGSFEKAIALANYRKTVEPLRAYWIADRIAYNYKRQVASAVGTAFKETITNVAWLLSSKYNIPRERISIIWGGKKEYKPENLLSKEQLDDLLKDPGMTLIKRCQEDKTLRKQITTTLRYMQDRDEHSETISEQAIRHNRLRELKLVGTQSANQRQIEIDKYQNGESIAALFTNASGGIGLSFDKYKPELWKREGLFTPVYSGKEFQQVLGRLVRRASIEDADQLICMMRGTVEEYHVAPILDEKLKCIAEITNRNFDIIELLLRTDSKIPTRVRDHNEAVVDAEKDNTVVSDIISSTEEDEDEEDDDMDLESAITMH
jgi:hypothetical protein